MSRYVQIIPAVPVAVARCYYVDEDGKRIRSTGEYWQAPIVCYGLTDRGDIERRRSSQYSRLYLDFLRHRIRPLVSPTFYSLICSIPWLMIVWI